VYSDGAGGCAWLYACAMVTIAAPVFSSSPSSTKTALPPRDGAAGSVVCVAFPGLPGLAGMNPKGQHSDQAGVWMCECVEGGGGASE
jgi:hypothetical protein